MTLSEVLYLNKIKVRKKEIARLKKLDRVNKIKGFIFNSLLIVILIICLFLNYKMNDNAINNCMKSKNYNYCVEHS